jgi:hypothetical protein
MGVEENVESNGARRSSMLERAARMMMMWMGESGERETSSGGVVVYMKYSLSCTAAESTSVCPKLGD